MIIKSRDRPSVVYLDTDDFQLARGLPPTKRGESTYVGLRTGDSVELNAALANALEWCG